MDRPLSDVSYAGYTTDPDALDLPAVDAAPLPQLIEPAEMPPVTDPAGDAEPLVEVAHRRVRVLSPYWHEGWTHARPGALLRAGTADRVCTAADALPGGFGFAVFDGWRPLDLQREIYDAAYADPALPPGFVSLPSTDPATPPPHLTGGCVDLTLTYQGVPLELGTQFDAFTADAHADAFEHIPGRVRDLRRLLYHTMRRAGFVVIDCEWWHFEFGTRRWAALCGQAPLYGPATPNA